MGTTFVPLAASGLVAPVLLVEVLTASGAYYCWSEHKTTWPTVLQSGNSLFLDYLTGEQRFQITGTTETDTATVTVQNISGNTVMRDVATAFSKAEFIGALVYCRLWKGDAQTSLFSFMGNVSNAEIDEQTMVLSIEGFGNWSAVPAPAYNIDVSCPLSFGSVACGSTSPIPCDLTYGNCSSIERFAGTIVEWITDQPNTQVAQPAPAVFYNPARAF
jgi:hypothetical protein